MLALPPGLAAEHEANRGRVRYKQICVAWHARAASHAFRSDLAHKMIRGRRVGAAIKQKSRYGGQPWR